MTGKQNIDMYGSPLLVESIEIDTDEKGLLNDIQVIIYKSAV